MKDNNLKLELVEHILCMLYELMYCSILYLLDQMLQLQFISPPEFVRCLFESGVY